MEHPMHGRITFSLTDIAREFPSITKSALTGTLRRLVEASKIHSVWRGFYVIVPVEYALKGVVPPTMYIDQLMQYLDEDYYIGLLNAASFYGAAHQQPQEFTIITRHRNFREKTKDGVKINFVTKKVLPAPYIRQIATKTGYVNVSSPEMTAVDLLLYPMEVGGLNRAATVLNELADDLHFDQLPSDFFGLFPTTALQRLGYLLDEVLGYTDVAQALRTRAIQSGIKFRYVPLKPENQVVDASLYEKSEQWKIIINEEIAIDE
jgi:predicted transcriptional regulator of viral defense system